MINILDNLREENELCEIDFSSEGSEKFEVGYIVAVSDKYVLLESVETNGTHGGFVFNTLEDICRVQYKTRYIKKIQKLMGKALFVPKPSPVEGGNILEELLFYVQSAQRICYYALFDRDFFGYGYVKEFNAETVTFQLVDEYGNFDGESVVRRDDITCLSFGGAAETKLEKLV